MFTAARHTLEAGRERLPQGRALLLPTLNLSGSATRIRTGAPSSAMLQCRIPSGSPDQVGYTLSLNQPIFRMQNVIQYRQADHQVRQAEATFGQAYQDLIVRTAAVLLRCARRAGYARAGARAEGGDRRAARAGKRNFEVGTATITDTHEAQARYDLNSAQEIAALNDLESKRRALQILTGREIAELVPLLAGYPAKSAQSARYGGLGRHRGKERLPHPDRGGCRRSGGARGARRSTPRTCRRSTSSPRTARLVPRRRAIAPSGATRRTR